MHIKNTIKKNVGTRQKRFLIYVLYDININTNWHP